MATFEKFFIDYLADAMGQAISMLLVDDGISVIITDKERLSKYHSEANFEVRIKYSSKDMATKLLDAVEKAIDELPWKKPLVMFAYLLSQSAIPEGSPVQWNYTGTFTVRYHQEDSY